MRIQRNLVVFKNYSNHNNLATQILIKSLEYVHCALAPKPPARITQKLITDGSTSETSGLAGGGGLVRDDRGTT